MIYLARPEDVSTWFVSFHRTCDSPFWRRIIPGRWKHVRAFAWAEGPRVWVFYDVMLIGGTRITIAPGGEGGDALVGQYIAEASVLKLRRGPEIKPPLTTLLGFWCVPAIRRLLNLPEGALLPEALWRDCLSHGAEIIVHELQPTLATAGPDAGRAGADRAAHGDAASPAVAWRADREPVVDVRQRQPA